MKPLTREEARRIDALAQERFLLPSDLLMENAGSATARLAETMLTQSATPFALVLCGPGNNGGDGYVAARHLLGKCAVEVFALGDPTTLGGDALRNHRRFALLGGRVTPHVGALVLESWFDAHPDGLVIDSLFGIGLERPLEGDPAESIACVNRRARRVLAVDIPSGLDCDDGSILGQAIRATRTLTFVAPKAGFASGHGPRLCGEVIVAPIGFPVDVDLRMT